MFSQIAAQQFLAGAQVSALQHFMSGTESLLGDDAFADLGLVGDEANLSDNVQAIIENEELFQRVLPAAVDTFIEFNGVGSLDQILAEESVSHAPLTSDLLLAAESSQGLVSKQRPPQRLDILSGAVRQSSVWRQLEERDPSAPLSLTDGALATTGKFDAIMMLFTQQAAALRRRRDQGVSSPAPNTPQHFVAHTLRSKSDVDALRYTAGVHKAGLALSEYPEGVTAYPGEAQDNLAPHFQLRFFTPPGSVIEKLFSEDRAREFATGGLILFGTKSFSKTGKDIDEWSASVLEQVGRADDVGTGYVAGYTGHGDIFSKRMPTTLAEGERAFHIGIGTTHLDRGRLYAAFLTGQDIDEATILTVGGANVYVYSNFNDLELERPLKVSVYDDVDLRRTQTLWPIYKNVYSGILGQELFDWVWKKMQETKGEISAELLSEAEDYYLDLMEQAKDEMRQVLSDVEGIPADKVHVLDCSMQDANGSWRLRDGGMRKFFHLVQNLFFGTHDEGKIDAGRLRQAVRQWQNEIDQVFATRNPRAGAAIAAGMEALRYGFVSSAFALMPKKVVFEGLNTTDLLDIRLKPEQLSRLPQRLKNYYEMTRQTRRPTAVPPSTRRELANLAALLAQLAAGNMPTPEQAMALRHRRVSKAELEDTMAWQNNPNAEFVAEVLNSIKKHLEKAQELIAEFGQQHAQLSRGTSGLLDAMAFSMELLADKVLTANERKRMRPQDAAQVLQAINAFLTAGNRFYVEDNITNTVEELAYRVATLYAFLSDFHKDEAKRTFKRPYPSVHFDLEALQPTIVRLAGDPEVQRRIMPFIKALRDRVGNS